MSYEVWTATGLRERWDTATRTYTRWNDAGAVVESRPFTAAENARADAEQSAQALETNRTTIRQQAETALASNRDTLDAINTQLGKANPTTIAGLAVVVRALLEAEAASIRQRQGIIRLILDRVDGLD